MGILAETTGFEPATYGLTGRYANRYTTSPRLKISAFVFTPDRRVKRYAIEHYSIRKPLTMTAYHAPL